MPYILDQAATKDLEEWILQTNISPTTEGDGAYSYPCEHIPISVWKACDYRMITAVQLVSADIDEGGAFAAVVAPETEDGGDTDADIWLLPYFDQTILAKLLVSLEI